MSRSFLALLVAGCALMAAPATALAASGSGGQVVSGAVASVITVTPTAVSLTGLTPGAPTPATGAGTVTVTSTDCYDLAVSSSTDGFLQGAQGDAFTARLQWKLAGGTFADLRSTPVTVALHEATTLGKAYSVLYQQPVADQNVKADVYTATATFAASSSSCS